MKNNSGTPISVADINKYLEESNSFQFEMNVFKSLLEHGYTAQRNGTYVDPVSSKDREYDIRAQFTRRDKFHLKMAIECKNLKPSSPLLVSRIPRQKVEAYSDLIISGMALTGGRILKLTNHSSAFYPDEMVGKSMAHLQKTEVKENKVTREEITGKDAEIHDKYTQAVASAHELIHQSGSSVPSTNIYDISCTIILPILVIADDTLWVVDYTSEGTRTGDPELATECSYFLGKAVQKTSGSIYSMSHLLIFTKSGFDNYIADLSVEPTAFKL